MYLESFKEVAENREELKHSLKGGITGSLIAAGLMYFFGILSPAESGSIYWPGLVVMFATVFLVTYLIKVAELVYEKRKVQE